jgi:hypothetical protein
MAHMLSRSCGHGKAFSGVEHNVLRKLSGSAALARGMAQLRLRL